MRADLDSLGFPASKLWNIARWTADRIWSELGQIPGHAELSSYLKSHERYADLNAQSSQRVIQELAEAFHSWYHHRRNGNQTVNPPGYRKDGDQHPDQRSRSRKTASRTTPRTNGFAFRRDGI